MPKSALLMSTYCQAQNRYHRRCRHRVLKPVLFCSQHPVTLSTYDCVQTIKEYLRQVKWVATKKRKTLVVRCLYRFLVSQPIFVHQYPRFEQAVERKTRQLAVDMPELVQSYEQLFQRSMPTP